MRCSDQTPSGSLASGKVNQTTYLPVLGSRKGAYGSIGDFSVGLGSHNCVGSALVILDSWSTLGRVLNRNKYGVKVPDVANERASALF